MNVKKIKILASAIVMIQCASCQQIEEKTYEIRAEAVDGSNKPIANVMVLRDSAIINSAIRIA
jgi:hypothetical protein